MKNISIKITKKIKNNKILIAYSGGLDSTILLYLFINKNIRAIHINHIQNEISYICNQHCRKICKTLNIILIIKNIYIINIQKQGFEAKARYLRYKKIKKYIKKKEILLTGHHNDDQIETLFLSLKRGSGPLGLSGISKYKTIKNIKILRPLITIKKKKIYKWAKKKNIFYINDISNLNITYDRNFIRCMILPILHKRWKYIKKNITKTIKLCNEQNILIKYFIKKNIINLTYNTKILNIFKIKYINKIMRNNILRYWFKTTKKIFISQNNLNQINKNIILTKKKKKTINIKNFLIEKFKNKIYISKIKKNIKNLILYWENIKIPLILPYKLGFLTINKNKKIIIPKIKKNEIINIRFNLNGKYLTFNNKYIILKKKWKKYNIPIHKRKKIPLLFYNNKFILAIGIEKIKIKKNKKKIFLLWNKKNK